MSVKSLWVGALLLIVVKGFSQVPHDGPYVFYSDDKVVVKIVKQDKATSDQFGMKGHRDLKVLVKFPGHMGWDFRVNLKPALENEPSIYPDPEKIFAVSDIEGEFNAFRKLMITNGIMDKHYNWTFGKGHLIVCGDLFDRGTQVNEYLWLLYRLEDRAKAKGGYVHVILGNHDIMNLSGDLRYVDNKYFSSAKTLGMDYMKLYDADTELGRWLRTKNVMEKIGDQLFLHAGLSPEINTMKLSVERINDMCRPYYATPGKELPSAMQAFFGKDAPFWYRGYFMQPKATMQDVENTLAFYGVKRIIVGHTIVDKNIAMYYNGRIIGIDVDHHTGKKHVGALYVNGKWYVADDNGIRTELIYKPENDNIKQEQIL